MLTVVSGGEGSFFKGLDNKIISFSPYLIVLTTEFFTT